MRATASKHVTHTHTHIHTRTEQTKAIPTARRREGIDDKTVNHSLLWRCGSAAGASTYSRDQREPDKSAPECAGPAKARNANKRGFRSVVVQERRKKAQTIKRRHAKRLPRRMANALYSSNSRATAPDPTEEAARQELETGRLKQNVDVGRRRC